MWKIKSSGEDLIILRPTKSNLVPTATQQCICLSYEDDELFENNGGPFRPCQSNRFHLDIICSNHIQVWRSPMQLSLPHLSSSVYTRSAQLLDATKKNRLSHSGSTTTDCKHQADYQVDVPAAACCLRLGTDAINRSRSTIRIHKYLLTSMGGRRRRLRLWTDANTNDPRGIHIP